MKIKWPEWPKMPEMPEITDIDIDKMYDRQADALERIAAALEKLVGEKDGKQS